MISALKKLFTPNPVQQRAGQLYSQLVQQARQPFYYQECAVPDTVPGRLEMILLQLAMMQKYLQQSKSEDSFSLSRALAEYFMADMDRSLREMGIGDTSIGKRMKLVTAAYFGRLHAYQDALEHPQQLSEVLNRNVYDAKVSASALSALSTRVAEQWDRLLKLGLQEFSK